MKKIKQGVYTLLLCISLVENSIIPRKSSAFVPKINEPSQEELEYKSIQIRFLH